jgi:hypothetical protein
LTSYDTKIYLRICEDSEGYLWNSVGSKDRALGAREQALKFYLYCVEIYMDFLIVFKI